MKGEQVMSPEENKAIARRLFEEVLNQGSTPPISPREARPSGGLLPYIVSPQGVFEYS